MRISSGAAPPFDLNSINRLLVRLQIPRGTAFGPCKRFCPSGTASITPGLPPGSAKAKPLAFREAAASHFRALSLEPPLSIWPLSGYALAPGDAQRRSRAPYDLSGPFIRVRPIAYVFPSARDGIYNSAELVGED